MKLKTRLAIRLTSVAATLLSALLMMGCRAKKTVVDSTRPADDDTEILDPVADPASGQREPIMVLYGLAPENRVPVMQKPAE